MRRRLRLASAGVVLALSSACATWQERAAAGAVADACVLAHEDFEEAFRFSTWVAAHSRARATLVPHATVQAALGAAVVGYGTDVGLYDITVDVPGGEASLHRFDASATALLARLAPLRIERAPMRPPGPLTQTPTPLEPWQRDGNSGASVGLGFGDALGAMARGVGAALGTAVSIPVQLMVGIVDGVFGPARGSGGGGYSAPPPLAPPPVVFVDMPRVSADDALLEHDAWRAAVAAVEADYAQRRAQVDAEQARRAALWRDGVPALMCPHGAVQPCRRVATPGRVSESVDVNFIQSSMFGLRRCATRVDVSVALPAASAPVIAPVNLPVTARALDDAAPTWSNAAAAATVDVRGSETSASIVGDLACSVETTKHARDRDGTAPDLAVRVTAGETAVRSARTFLGEDVASAHWVVPHLALTQGERLRVTVRSTADEGRSLGGDVFIYRGELPFAVQSKALTVRCGAADPVKLNAAVAEARAALGLARGALAAARVPSPAASGAPAPTATGSPNTVRAIEDVRTRAAALAGLAGWDDADVGAAVADIAPVQPRAP